MSSPPPLSSPAPNVSSLLGTSLALYLLERYGSVSRLATFSDAEWRELGVKDILTRKCHEGNIPVGLGVSHELLLVAERHRFGFLLFAPLIRDAYLIDGSSDVARTVDSNLDAIKKSLKLLSKKAVIVARADGSGGSPDGSVGIAIHHDLSESFAHLGAKAVVSSSLKEVPVPEHFDRNKPATHRGGRKVAHIQNQIRQRLGLTTTREEREKEAKLKEIQHVSEEKQEQVLNSREFRGMELREQQRRAEKQKRAREEEEAMHRRLAPIGSRAEAAAHDDDLDALFAAKVE
mmetsp:Transcript_30335/g.35013  ORF Transcript_30335/g.35013 Transcript_30335/m.35013 type:complete len:290 (-) Transcript_30335:21-890(-)